MTSGETGGRLIAAIEKAMHDLEITPSEYNEIINTAGEDSHIDSQEKELLKQFHELLSNGTIKRVREK